MHSDRGRSPAPADGVIPGGRHPGAPATPSAHGPTGNLGLGLYIAERIVDAHGGRTDVQSFEGQGTPFTISLPRRETWVTDPRPGDASSA